MENLCLSERKRCLQICHISQGLPPSYKLAVGPRCPRRSGRNHCNANWGLLHTGKKEDCTSHLGNRRVPQMFTPRVPCAYPALWPSDIGLLKVLPNTFSGYGNVSSCLYWVLVMGEIKYIKLWTSGMNYERRMTALVSWIKKSHYWVVIFREEMPNA